MSAKRSLTIRGHRTSISIESPFWDEVQRIAARRTTSIAALVAEVDASRAPEINLSSALRLFVLADVLERVGKADAR